MATLKRCTIRLAGLSACVLWFGEVVFGGIRLGDLCCVVNMYMVYVPFLTTS